MDEIIAKHRDSGHYDDPEYDFEGWLRNILPNIKPGMKNVHMYRGYQIWPEIREWTREEFDNIPSSLWKYLGGTYGTLPTTPTCTDIPCRTLGTKATYGPTNTTS
jgi:hypothetical protein